MSSPHSSGLCLLGFLVSSRCELGVHGGVLPPTSDPLEGPGEVGFGVDAVELRGLDERVRHRGVLGRLVANGEEPVVAAERLRSQISLSEVVLEREVGCRIPAILTSSIPKEMPTSLTSAIRIEACFKRVGRQRAGNRPWDIGFANWLKRLGRDSTDASPTANRVATSGWVPSPTSQAETARSRRSTDRGAGIATLLSSDYYQLITFISTNICQPCGFHAARSIEMTSAVTPKQASIPG